MMNMIKCEKKKLTKNTGKSLKLCVLKMFHEFVSK